MSDIGQQIRAYIGSNFIVSLETTFHIQIADEEMIPEHLDSLGNVAAYATHKLSPAVSGNV